MKRFLTPVLLLGTCALLAGCEERTSEFTPIDLEKMRPLVELPGGKPPPSMLELENQPVSSTFDETVLRESVETVRTEQAQAHSRIETSFAPDPSNRPYLEGGDLSPLGTEIGPGSFPSQPGSEIPEHGHTPPSF